MGSRARDFDGEVYSRFTGNFSCDVSSAISARCLRTSATRPLRFILPTTLRWFLGGNNQTGGNPSYSVTASAVTGGLDVNEDTSGLFTGLSIADPDVGASDISVTLDVANGDLALTSIAGLTQTDADGTDGTLAFSGSLADVNAALAGLEYTGDADFNGQDFLNIAVDDGGNTGTGGAMSDAKSVVINVAAVNDAPVAVADTLSVTEVSGPVLTYFEDFEGGVTDAHNQKPDENRDNGVA